MCWLLPETHFCIAAHQTLKTHFVKVQKTNRFPVHTFGCYLSTLHVRAFEIEKRFVGWEMRHGLCSIIVAKEMQAGDVEDCCGEQQPVPLWTTRPSTSITKQTQFTDSALLNSGEMTTIDKINVWHFAPRFAFSQLRKGLDSKVIQSEISGFNRSWICSTNWIGADCCFYLKLTFFSSEGVSRQLHLAG